MSKVVITKTDKLSKNEWLRLRKRGIGGSNAAAVCGMNRWRGPLDVYLDKTSKTIDEHDSEAMYWGRTMEPILREEFTKRSGLKAEAMPYMFSCKEYPFMLADIDGIVHEKDNSTSLLEIKTAGSYAAQDWENGLPQEYYIQIQHYLAVVDLPKAYVAVLIGGNDFRYFAIDRDEEVIPTIIALESAFWHQNVLGLVQPEADSTSASILGTMYPKSNGTSIILPDEADQLIQNIEEYKRLEEQIKTGKAEAENKLKALMKDAELGKTPSGYSVKWKTSQTSRLDTTALKKDHADLVQTYTKVTSYRRFSVSAPKTSK